SAVAFNLILIGMNDWSVLLIKFLHAHAPDRWRVIALLDEEPRWFGRSVNGVQVFGPPAHLEALVEEFAAHGVRTDSVVMAISADELSKDALANVQSVCAERDLDLVFAPNLLGRWPESADRSARRPGDLMPGGPFPPAVQPTPYHRLKRLFDVVAALAL